jgi:hypothetical protein
MATVLPRLVPAIALAALLPGVAAAEDAPASSASSASSAAPAAPATSPAPAEPPAPVEPTPAWQTAPTTRRGGFVVGAAVGLGVASIAGFPNDVKKIGYAPYYTATGVRPTFSPELWIGGALTDWITFGIGVTLSDLVGPDKGTSVAGMFHIEVFPLFYVSEKLRDLGVMLDAGTGTASVRDAGGTQLVDGSAASLVGGGVFWEPIAAWKIRGGPFLMGNYMWSDTARRPALFAGWRMSLYTKP